MSNSEYHHCQFTADKHEQLSPDRNVTSFSNLSPYSCKSDIGFDFRVCNNFSHLNISWFTYTDEMLKAFRRGIPPRIN